MTKVILLSQVPLPYSKIGSWTTLYDNYLRGSHQIDYIVCPKTSCKYENIAYSFFNEGLFQKIKSKIIRKRFNSYFKALEKIIRPDEKYIIQVIDNFKIIPELEAFLIERNVRGHCYIQFFYHGFPPFLAKDSGEHFFEAINEMVVLTNDSYKQHIQYYNTLATKFSILYNGVDTSKFFKVSNKEKEQLRNKNNVKAKNIFIWCSQDRPKKGLDFILDVWKRVYSETNDMELLVVGANRTVEVNGVRFLGKIPNHHIAQFYQLADVYLFPTLCQEGFGLSLVEALHSGCYCIASKMGGVPEVLNYGEYGKLIDKPHFMQEWIDAITFYLKTNTSFKNVPTELYSKEAWCSGMNAIISSAKISLL